MPRKNRPRDSDPRKGRRAISGRDLSEIAERVIGPAELQVPGYTVKRSANAGKRYLCPYCQGWIQPATAHVVAYPAGNLDERRHYHTPCWTRENPGKKPNSR